MVDAFFPTVPGLNLRCVQFLLKVKTLKPLKTTVELVCLRFLNEFLRCLAFCYCFYLGNHFVSY